MNAGGGRAGSALQFYLYNTTGSGISGFHYDPLVREVVEAEEVPRVSLLRPRASRASRVVSLHDASPLETAVRRETEAAARARGRVEGGERGRIVDIDGEDFLETEARRGAEAMARARRRVEEGGRGRAVDFDGRDIDRSAGGPTRPLG